jgi:hypothetical protein
LNTLVVVFEMIWNKLIWILLIGSQHTNTQEDVDRLLAVHGKPQRLEPVIEIPK